MNIEKTIQDNITYFKNIEVGQPFLYDDELYIHTKTFCNYNFTDLPSNAVNLRTGEARYFTLYDAVKKVKATIKIEEN